MTKAGFEKFLLKSYSLSATFKIHYKHSFSTSGTIATMSDLISATAKICYTAAGCLIHQDRVLLVKHKKLGLWLNPGGHIEENEVAHQAAEREFWEETGITVRAVGYNQLKDDGDTQFVPAPFAANVHWISKQNYDARLQAEQVANQGTTDKKSRDKATSEYGKQKGWERGCEQHYNFMFLVEPVDGVDFKQNVEETDGIAWFSLDELSDLEIKENIRAEIAHAFFIKQTR